MSTKTKYVFKSILVILKNATIIIPLIEGVINAILAMLTPPPAEESEPLPESEQTKNLGYK